MKSIGRAAPRGSPARRAAISSTRRRPSFTILYPAPTPPRAGSVRRTPAARMAPSESVSMKTFLTAGDGGGPGKVFENSVRQSPERERTGVAVGGVLSGREAFVVPRVPTFQR